MNKKFTKTYIVLLFILSTQWGGWGIKTDARATGYFCQEVVNLHISMEQIRLLLAQTHDGTLQKQKYVDIRDNKNFFNIEYDSFLNGEKVEW